MQLKDMTTEQSFEYARAKLEEMLQQDQLNKYSLLPEANGKITVLLSFTFDPKEMCLKVLRMTPTDEELKKMSKYKSEWKDNDLNVDFWKEVLEGRTIKHVTFDQSGIHSLILDSGEEVFLPKELKGGRLFIKD